jgi:tetratricopeptide (TPR) repeat protein
MAPVASLSIEMRAGFDKLGADLKKINRSFNSFEKDISQNFSKIGTALNLVIGGVAIAGLVKLGNEIGRLADKGEQVGSIAESFQKLGGSSTVIEDARGRIIGLVGAFDLMAIANKGLVAGIPGFQNAFANIVDLGGRLANTFGKDTKVAVEELTDAIVKGQAKALVPLGFSFTDTSNKALVTQEALAQLTKVMERFNPVGDSVSNAMTSFSITLDEAWAKMGIGINSSTELTAAIRMFEQAIKQIDLQQFGKDLADLIAKLVSLGGDVLPIVIQGFRNFKEAINWFSDAKGTTSELVQLNNQLEQLKAAQAQVQAQSPWADNSKQIEQYQRDIDITWKKIQELNKELNKPTDLGPIGPNRSLQDPKTWVREEKAKVKEVFQYREALMTKEIEEYYQRMKDSFDKIASSFGGALSKLGIDGEKLTSGLAGLFSPEEKTGFLNQISQMLGISADKFTAFAEGAAETLGAVFEAGAINKKTSSEAGTGGAVGAGLGAIFGGPEGAKIGNVLGSMIGGMFKWGAKNPQTLARQAFEQFLEDAFKDLRVRFFGKDGKLGGMFNGNFVGKGLTTDFNGGKWTQNMAAWGDKATGTFLGLGEAMKELQGITEDVGAQIGYMLGTNLAGNIDNAKLLVMELGLSFEQVSDALLKSALKGSISWAEFNRYIGETAEAFKPGLAAVGAINEAFQNLIDGAGQGRISVKSFKDVAVEAMEAGVTSMEGLKQRHVKGQ